MSLHLPSKLALPDVTLMLIETREHELGLRALEDCEALCDFGEVLVFTDRPSFFLRADRTVTVVPDWPEKIGWSKFFWHGCTPHIRTSHVLGIQWDSWVVDPGMWRDEFLAWDYIGAPWWYKDGLNVGNGGFCLRSTALLRYVTKHRDRYKVLNDLDDDLFSRKYRLFLQSVGFNWAPETVAKDFAFECVRPDPESRHFGFHAAYNFDFGCGGDEGRLRDRARLMMESSYITGTNRWSGLAKKFPWMDEMRGELHNVRA